MILNSIFEFMTSYFTFFTTINKDGNGAHAILKCMSYQNCKSINNLYYKIHFNKPITFIYLVKSYWLRNCDWTYVICFGDLILRKNVQILSICEPMKFKCLERSQTWKISVSPTLPNFYWNFGGPKCSMLKKKFSCQNNAIFGKNEK